jgi:hypothetical protein
MDGMVVGRRCDGEEGVEGIRIFFLFLESLGARTNESFLIEVILFFCKEPISALKVG